MSPFALVMILLAAVMLYAASRALAGLAGSAGGRGFAHSIPVFAVAVGAVWMKLDALAIGVIFGTSVMTATLVAGVALLSGQFSDDSMQRRTWPFMLPVAAMALVAGLRGGVDLSAVAAFLILAAAIFWVSREVRTARAIVPGSLPVATSVLSLIVVVIAVCLLVWVFVQDNRFPAVLTPGLFGATVAGPLLVLPMLGAVSEQVQQTASADLSLAMLVSFVMINLTAWLPLTALVRLARQRFDHAALDTMLPIPVGVWRVDCIFLLMIGLALVPIGLGRWKLRKLEGILLIVAYLAYLGLIGLIGWREIAPHIR